MRNAWSRSYWLLSWGTRSVTARRRGRPRGRPMCPDFRHPNSFATSRLVRNDAGPSSAPCATVRTCSVRSAGAGKKVRAPLRAHQSASRIGRQGWWAAASRSTATSASSSLAMSTTSLLSRSPPWISSGEASKPTAMPPSIPLRLLGCRSQKRSNATPSWNCSELLTTTGESRRVRLCVRVARWRTLHLQGGWGRAGLITKAARLERGRVEDVEREGSQFNAAGISEIPVPALVSGSKRVRHCHSVVTWPQPCHNRIRMRTSRPGAGRTPSTTTVVRTGPRFRCTRPNGTTPRDVGGPDPRRSPGVRWSCHLRRIRGRLIPPSTPTRRRLGPADREAAELRSDHRDADPGPIEPCDAPRHGTKRR